MNLIDVNSKLGTEELALEFLEQKRWPNGVECVKCYGKKISKFVAKGRERVNKKGETVRSPDRHLYQCLNPECKHQFSATTGTVFQDSHLPLSKWFLSIALMMDAKKGVSARQLQRHLGVKSYETAWYLAHRIREAMIGSAPAIFRGTVENGWHVYRRQVHEADKARTLAEASCNWAWRSARLPPSHRRLTRCL